MTIATLNTPSQTSQHVDLLSERERAVMTLVAHGLTNAEVAAELFISVATVKTHLAHVLRKLRVRDRVALVVFAWREGLVRVEGDERAPRRCAHRHVVHRAGTCR